MLADELEGDFAGAFVDVDYLDGYVLIFFDDVFDSFYTRSV